MRWRNARGANLVEMALVVPLLLLLLMGAADLGRVFYAHIAITNAAREAARYASRFPDNEQGIQDVARNEAANGGITLSDDGIEISSLSAVPGDPIRVSISCEVKTILGEFVDAWFGTSFAQLRLSNSTQMVVFGMDDAQTPAPE